MTQSPERPRYDWSTPRCDVCHEETDCVTAENAGGFTVVLCLYHYEEMRTAMQRGGDIDVRRPGVVAQATAGGCGASLRERAQGLTTECQRRR